MTDDDPNLILKQAVFILCMSLMVVCLTLIIVNQRNIPNHWNGHTQSKYSVLEYSYLQGRGVPFMVEGKSVASLLNQLEVPKLLYEIIKCESRWNPEVCSYAGCKAGMGLAQLIPSTVKYCEEKIGKKIDPFNADDNLECAIWLYENEGTHHWGYEEVKDEWGSYNCWSKYIK